MNSLQLAPSSSPSTSSASFRLCLLFIAIATFSPPTAHAFVIAPSFQRGGIVVVAKRHHQSSPRGSARYFTTQLASSTVKDSTKTTKLDQKQVTTIPTSSSPPPAFSSSSMFDFFKTAAASEAESTSLSSMNAVSTTTANADESAPTTASPSLETVLKVAGGVLVAFFALLIHSMGWTMTDVTSNVEMLLANPQETMNLFLNSIQDLGPAAPLYFGIAYFLAELLAIPATPLTLSAGYLFGLQTGSLVVLTAAVAAASVSFFIGKTVLRGAVQEILQQNPKWAKLDEALGSKEGTTGFKLLLLVRLTPLFPFAIANYIYGASAIDFRSYFFATLLGFAPGTVAYVYTGMVGQALTSGGGDGSQPWYVYAGGLAVLGGLLKLATDVATNVIDTMGVNDDDDDDQKTSSL